MTQSNFEVVRAEWPDVFEAASRAESSARTDPRTSCFYARRALELAVFWMYKHDPAVKLPYQENLGALIHDPTFKQTVGAALFAKARLIKELGNLAAHSPRPLRDADALRAVEDLFHFLFWLARTYSRGQTPPDALTFDSSLIPTGSPIPAQSVAQIQKLESDLAARDERLYELIADRQNIDAELQALRAEIAAIKAANNTRPDAHDYSEAETRDYFIDLLLKEAGWPLTGKNDLEYEVSGMPTKDGRGYVDYVLWGDDGKPLGLVEAKRTRKDARVGQQQAKLYADCLEKEFGRRPVIFYSNGYEHWIWDDAFYPPRPVQGFYKKDELELLVQRRTTRKTLESAALDERIVERYYQTRAIRRIGEAFERDHERKALLVMATGAGKTRTVIALCDLLMRCNWVKRVLFLADRIALVNQAVGAFKRHLPNASPVNLVTEPDAEGRVFISTYPTVMGLIDQRPDGARRFGPGHFDLVVIDEAHRSVYKKYGAIFDYFDSLLVGLTATPKDEVDRHTYRLFDLETNVPTDAYDLVDAVADGFLVPAKPVAVPIKFPREGITYADLPEEEKEEWDAIEWDESGQTPARVEAAAVNSWLMNEDTVDKVLEHLMARGLKVAGGDRLGKTILFAKNHEHALFIAKRFDDNYPKFRGLFARVIDVKIPYAQTVIDDFAKPDKPPYIAISVDMLDTGIDIPEVVNLVFFKVVRSKTKFWQMVGRGTRLSPDLFGPGRNKEFFYLFDYCDNLTFFGLDGAGVEGKSGDSLSTRLFKYRLELIAEIDGRLKLHGADVKASAIRDSPEESYEGAVDERVLRIGVAERLRSEVEAMNVDNFIVRPKRRLVEKWRVPVEWEELSSADLEEIARQIAPLPSELPTEEEEAKRFDALMLRLQLAQLRHEHSFVKLAEQVREIAGLLEEKANIPMVREQLALILEIQSDDWWEGATVSMFEDVRKKLRSLVPLIEKKHRRVVYSNFEDEIGDEVEVTLRPFAIASLEQFRAKARQFLREHESHVAVHKVRTNKPLTSSDLAELERILVESGTGTPEDVQRAAESNHGLGLFVRSLVGLDRGAAKEAFAGFLSGKSLGANQIEFMNLIIDHLTENGAMDPALLFSSPYTDFNPRGVEGLFDPSDAAEIVSILRAVSQTAAA